MIIICVELAAALSEDHAWVVFGKNQQFTAEVGQYLIGLARICKPISDLSLLKNLVFLLTSSVFWSVTNKLSVLGKKETGLFARTAKANV